jgi:hypothetical protein
MIKVSRGTRRVLKAHRNVLMAKSNVVAVGVGEETVDGKKTGREAVICFVQKKMPLETISAQDIVPQALDDGGSPVATDVVEIGLVKALAVADHRRKHRPIVPGISVGHYKITAGTLGLIVEKDGEAHILSNNHVLADSNHAALGDKIYQPGPYDGGNTTSEVAVLSHFVPIHFDTTSENLVDCALARINTAVVVPPPEPPVDEPPVTPPAPGDSSGRKWCPLTRAFIAVGNAASKALGSGVRVQAYRVDSQNTVTVNGDQVNSDPLVDALEPISFTNEVLDMGAISGDVNYIVDVGDMVQKSGRTTGFTQDEIIATDVTVDVDYGADGTARFTNQLLAGSMSQGGDSGSVIFNENKDVVGLLFAGSDTVTIFCPIEAVFTKLGITRIL